jgi:Fe-S-cluster formation regulator IscX/YfhJ
MSRLDRVLAAVRAWREVREIAAALSFKSETVEERRQQAEEELHAAITDLDAFSKKDTERFPTFTPKDEIPPTDKNS